MTVRPLPSLRPRIRINETLTLRTEPHFRRQRVMRPIRGFCTDPLTQEINRIQARISFLMEQPKEFPPPKSKNTATIKKFWTNLLNSDIDLPLHKVTPLETHHWNAFITLISKKPELLKEEISLPSDLSESRLIELFKALRIQKSVLPALSFTNEAKEAHAGYGPEICLKNASAEEINISADFILSDAIRHSYLQVQNIELTDSNIARLSQTIVRLQPQCVCDLVLSPNSSKIRK